MTLILMSKGFISQTNGIDRYKKRADVLIESPICWLIKRECLEYTEGRGVEWIMYWTRICQTLFVMGLVICGTGFSQVESFETPLKDSSPLSFTDPMLDPSLTGASLLQSPDLLSATTTTVLPPSLSSKRSPGKAMSGGRVEDVTGTGSRLRREWEQGLWSFGSADKDPDLETRLPARREEAQGGGLLPLSPNGGLQTLGWNGLSPIAPGQSLIQVPANTPSLETLKDLSPPRKSSIPEESRLGSRDLGSSLRRDEARDSSQPASSRLASQRTLESRKGKILPMPGTTPPPSGVGKGTGLGRPSMNKAVGGNIASTQLRSQSLSSVGGALPSQSTARSMSPRSTSVANIAPPQATTLPSRRFHGGQPGEARRPDYTYQYQGTRRYSVGETEYGNGNTYESLPYYRRKR